MPCGTELTQCELVVVFVIEDVHEGGKKWVKVLLKCNAVDRSEPGMGYLSKRSRTHVEDRELGEYGPKLFIK